MKINLLLVVLISIINPFNIRSQVNWKSENVILKGKVLNFEKNKNHSSVTFIFRDVIKREMQNSFVAELDNKGIFELRVPLLYPQDFYLSYGGLSAFICSPGDSLIFEIDAEGDKNPNGTYFARVTGGNRIKDNSDLTAFFKGRSHKHFSREYHEQFIRNRSAIGYSLFIKERENACNKFVDEFKKQNFTTKFFNQWVDDYIKYESWTDLMDYPGKHDEKDRVRRDEVITPVGYYDFLKEYDMNDHQIISTKHADFLYQYSRYVLRIPKDSMERAYKLFNNKEIIPGARVLMGMIRQNTSGFTRNLMLTKFYLDAIEGHQLKEFEELYDSASISDRYFKSVVADAHRKLQKYIANQVTDGANIKSINNSLTKNLIGTISSKYAGKVIYIDFWAPWCVPCMGEMSYSKEIQIAYKNKEIVFLFLASRCKEGSWKATIASQKLTGEHMLLTDDQFNILSGEFGITGIPHYVLIDKKGNIVFKSASRPSQKELVRKQIDNLL